MDALALLCNLHADGPATLQRLRRAGCDSLSALRRLDPAGLSEELGWNVRAAERFLREAALLGERMDEDGAAAGELEDPEFELESELVEELDGQDDESESEDDEDHDDDELATDEEPGFAPPAERVEAVLGTWRELDRVAPPDEPTEFVIPRPEPLPDRSLAEARLEGLPARLAARLHELGVHTVRELAGASALELARALPLGFTRLKHLQFLAARELERLPAPAAARPVEAARVPEVRRAYEPQRAYEPFEPPPAEPFETAGPFA